MTDLVFATNNKNKLREIKELGLNNYNILNLEDINCSEDLPENSSSLQGNASEKAEYVYEKYNADCFADDTGLEIEALQGRPGVYSARYAGEEKDFEKNIVKVLEELKGIKNRKARFLTVIALIIGGRKMLFEGIVNGIIIDEKKGTNGFGYDPVFKPDGYDITFAEMTMEEKNKISHRAVAFRKLTEYLNRINR